jgi:alpha-beta hydrolase superfamily lysophospholipase
MNIEEKFFSNRSNLSLSYNLKENGSPYWLIVTHGLGEHSRRHDYFYKLLGQHFNICSWDLRGHGKSEGKRAFCENFDDLIDDLDDFINHLRLNYKMEKYLLFGHSMGGLVTAAYVQQRLPDLDHYPLKVFLSSPAVAAAGLQGKFFSWAPMALHNTLNKLPFSLPLGGVLDLKKLSHDSRIYQSYVADKLNSTKVQTNLLFAILKKSKEVFLKPLRCECPLYCSIGTQDVLVSPDAVIGYFEQIEKNAQLFKLEGAYHEIHNEIEKYRQPYFDFLIKSLKADLFN